MPDSSQGGMAPPTIKGDQIVPMHLFDDTAANNNVLLSVTLCFDKVLHPERIHSALVRLLQIGEWRKLGGRLRRHVSPRRHKLTERDSELTMPSRTAVGSRFTYPNHSPRSVL